jgi:hypothetical protein
MNPLKCVANQKIIGALCNTNVALELSTISDTFLKIVHEHAHVNGQRSALIGSANS